MSRELTRNIFAPTVCGVFLRTKARAYAAAEMIWWLPALLPRRHEDIGDVLRYPENPPSRRVFVASGRDAIVINVFILPNVWRE